MSWTIRKHQNFTAWFNKLDLKTKLQVESRIENISLYGHFGKSKPLGDKVFELKFKNGTRVYFTFSKGEIIFLLGGGSKNGQEKDIKKAKKLID